MNRRLFAFWIGILSLIGSLIYLGHPSSAWEMGQNSTAALPSGQWLILEGGELIPPRIKASTKQIELVPTNMSKDFEEEGPNVGSGWEREDRSNNVDNTVFIDDFNDNNTNSSVWTTQIRGTGPMISETNQRLEITLPANSAGSDILAAYSTVCTLQGDFDIQVDFLLLDWPSNNGVRVGLSARYPYDAVERISFSHLDSGSGDGYLTHFADGIHGFVTANHLSGKLRLTRLGGTLTGYYFHSNEWIFIHSSSGTASDLSFGLAVWSHDSKFADQNVKVAFDNFVLTQGNIICPVPSPSYSISGRVTDANNNPISGVIVSPGSGHTDVTDSTGDYMLSGLPAGDYTITPSRSGYTFSPSSLPVTVPPDSSGVNFTGAQAQSPTCYTFNVTLNGQEEVPPNASTATGAATVQVDTTTKTLSYTISFSGLTGTETATHIQLAGPGENGPVVIALELGSPKSILFFIKTSHWRRASWKVLHTLIFAPLRSLMERFAKVDPYVKTARGRKIKSIPPFVKEAVAVGLA